MKGDKIKFIHCLREFKIYTNFALSNIDHIISLFILFGGIAIICASYFKGLGQYGMGIAFIAAIFGYYIVKYRGNQNNRLCLCSTDVLSKSIKQRLLLLDILFYMIFAIGMMYIHSFIYFRSWEYFIIVSIAFVILVLQSLHVNFSIKGILYILFKISIISLSLRASRFFAFPTIIGGGDASEHLLFAKSIQVLGYIQSYEITGNKYTYTPLWHILEAIIMIVVNNTFAISFFIFISVVTVAITFLIYTIGNKVFNFRVGLIAALFANIADMIFVKTVTSVDTSLIVMVYILVIALCFYYSQKTFFTISILSMLCIFFTHQISAFASYIIILGFFLGIVFGKKIITFLSKNINIQMLYRWHNDSSQHPNIIYMVIINIWFIFYFSITEYGNTNVFSAMTSSVINRVKYMIQSFQSTNELLSTPYEGLFQQYNLMDVILYNAGQNILLCLAILGIILFISYNINQYGTSIIIAISLLFFVIYVGTFLGLGWILFPHRLLPFMQLLCVIFSAYGIYILFNSIQINAKSCFILIIFVFILLLITTPYINRDDVLYCDANEARVQLTSSELTGIESGQKISTDGNIIVDRWVSTQYFSTIENIDINRDKLLLYPNKDGLAYIRNYVYDKQIFPRPGRFGTSGFIDYSNYLTSVTDNFMKIYDNKNVWIYRAN